MGKRLVFMLAVAVLFARTPPVNAQMGINVLVYDYASSIIRELNSRGEVVDSVQLPMPFGFVGQSLEVVFDPTGRYVAYVVSDLTFSHWQFMVYGYEDNQIHVAYPLDFDIYHSFIFSPSRYQVFNDIGQVVFAYTPVVNGNPGYDWRILIFDVNSGEIVRRLNMDNFPITLYEPLTMPLPYSLGANQLVFTLTHFNYDTNWSHAVHLWDFASGEVTRLPYNRSAVFDQSTTQMVTLQQPENLPSKTGFIENYLSLQSGDAAPEIFYANPHLSFKNVYFVENGARILAHAVNSQQQNMWMLLDMNGEVARSLPIDIQPNSVHSTPDGFVYSQYDSSQNNEKSEIYYVRLASGTYDSTLIASDVPGRLVGVRMTAPTVTEITPQIQPLFRVGDRVAITRAGNQLRMRLTPGGEVQRQFNAGSIVTIVGGPTEFTRTFWWQVRDENGLVGWVAQGYDEVSYLAQVQ